VQRAPRVLKAGAAAEQFADELVGRQPIIEGIPCTLLLARQRAEGYRRVQRRRHEGMSDDTQMGLRQRVGQLERILGQLTAERDEALAREAAIGEILRIINSSPGDLAPVFDAMLGKAARLCEAAFGTLWIRDGDVLRLAAHHGVPADLEKVLHSLGPIGPREGSALRRLQDGEDVLQFRDLAAEALPDRPGGRRAALIQFGGARTTLWVALRKDDRLVGVVHLYRREVRLFTDRQIALLQNFAAQAVVAMENARLLTETREALEQQTATAEVLQVINASPGDLAPVFDAMLDKALRLCDAAFGQLATYDGERFHRVAVKGEPRLVEYVQRRGPFKPRPDGSLGRIVRGEDVVYSEDVLQSEGYRANPHMREMVDIGGQRTSLNVALRKEGTLFGTIGSWWKEVRPLSDKQVAPIAKFRGAGGNRDGERAADHRDARGVGAADRDRRGAGRHQFLAR
jgi:GAF domain